MINNHNQHPLPSARLEWIQPFDGGQPQVTLPEQAVVSRRFDSLVDDLMLGHLAAVYNRNSNPAWPINTLELMIPDGEGHWMASVRNSALDADNKNELPVYKLPDKEIVLYFIDGEGNEREEFIYGLGHDGIVRREDNGDAWAQEQLEKELGLPGPASFPPHSTPEISQAIFNRMEAEADQAYQNKELEIAMGLNNQPIGVQELDSLAELLTSTSVIPLLR